MSHSGSSGWTRSPLLDDSRSARNGSEGGSLGTPDVHTHGFAASHLTDVPPLTPSCSLQEQILALSHDGSARGPKYSLSSRTTGFIERTLDGENDEDGDEDEHV